MLCVFPTPSSQLRSLSLKLLLSFPVPSPSPLGRRRDKIRALVRAKAEPGEVLRACDELRDLTLPQLGVKLDDAAGGGGALWKLYECAFVRPPHYGDMLPPQCLSRLPQCLTTVCALRCQVDTSDC